MNIKSLKLSLLFFLLFQVFIDNFEFNLQAIDSSIPSEFSEEELLEYQYSNKPRKKKKKKRKYTAPSRYAGDKSLDDSDDWFLLEPDSDTDPEIESQTHNEYEIEIESEDYEHSYRIYIYVPRA